MHRKDYFSNDMTLGQPLMRLVSAGKGIAFRDRNLELCGLHRRVEALEFANAGDAIVADDFHAAPLLGRGLDAVGVCNTAAWPKRIQASLQRVSTGKRQHGIDAVGCEAA